ncbi:NUDIX domain-containing protein [Streptomyces sp. NPDC086091]|uniref:NUDIX domain-containing protein n=1 Tax=Streptomyces sp. NPDC086091 TaxID=3365751 RepID=UPI00381756DF
MTETPPIDVHLFDVDRIHLVETAEPPLSSADRVARDRVWEAALRANPTLFDGPVVACAGLEHTGPRCVLLSWTRITYRHYALRRVPGAGAKALPSLFVNVLQPVDGGRVVAVRMAPSTAAPGRWQLPGGSVEPPVDGEPLDASALAVQASRELAEELGISVAPRALRLWVVTRGENGSIGLTYRAPTLSEAAVRAGFTAAADAERARGREPELDDVMPVRSPKELADLVGPHADYLAPIVRRYVSGASKVP